MRYGHFDTSAHEYVIERPDTPVSWTNYLGVKDMCTVISHNAPPVSSSVQTTCGPFAPAVT